MKNFISCICVTACLVGVILWQLLSDTKNYYIACVGVLMLSIMPFLISFEKSKPSAEELTLIASLISIAVVSRAVFYLIPQFKPIGAVVVVSGVCLGAKRGYLVGAFSMFISNFIFGQGIWTPFQMVALGLVGFISGLLFSKIKAKRLPLSVVGFLLTFLVYGIIVDLSSVLMLSGKYTIRSVLAVYINSLPFNLIFAICTFVFLFLFGEPFIKKINRITIKYGLLSEKR